MATTGAMSKCPICRATYFPMSPADDWCSPLCFLRAEARRLNAEDEAQPAQGGADE